MAGNKIRHMKRANVALLVIAAIALVVAISLAFTFSCGKSDDKGDFSDSGRGETAEGDGSGASAAGELTYSLKDGSYEVTWSGKCTETSVDIPSSYEGIAVTSIGDSAFYGCSTIVSLSIPDTVTSIGDYAFYNCTSLTEITIPSGVTTVGNYAFYGCTHLTEISFDAVAMDDLSANNYVFYNAGENGNGITVTVGVAVTKIPAYIFYPYSSTTSPKITTVIFEGGSKCSSIGTYAFANCIYLLSFTVPQNCKSIASNAFYNCYKLVQVYNLSSLNLTLGLDNYGYVAYYAVNVSSDYAAAGTFYTVGDVFVFYEYDDVRYFLTYNGTDSEITLPDSVDGKNYEILTW